jgi:hypothetical protein
MAGDGDFSTWQKPTRGTEAILRGKDTQFTNILFRDRIKVTCTGIQGNIS